jgi:hypothetical protein
MNERLLLGSANNQPNDQSWVCAAIERLIAAWTILAAHRVDRVPETHRLGGSRLSRYSVFTQ